MSVGVDRLATHLEHAADGLGVFVVSRSVQAHRLAAQLSGVAGVEVTLRFRNKRWVLEWTDGPETPQMKQYIAAALNDDAFPDMRAHYEARLLITGHYVTG
ncbi:hypothetical protein [Yinghuangia soli]|uniref:Uncharacterized protein n=1 Tax=Yinghuangia soli TaxID=2908204 RepID=A0AA41PUV8_9ACTN|nr:hypothetical protein [Yinghuangia soli]MCF2526027.1 hypothetical protein [Yinghuangia soli]